MSVRVGSGMSELPDPRDGAAEAAMRASASLGVAPADVVFVFASGAHLAAPEETLAAVHEELAPGALAGCGAGGVLGDGREVEGGTAVSVWAASLGEGRAESFHVHVEPAGDALVVEGLPSPAGASAIVMLADPYSFPTDRVLEEVARIAPGVPILGGLASARTLDGGGALMVDDQVVAGGAVGIRLEGVEVLPCVSQGAVPIGPPLAVTDADAHVIRALDSRPALDVLRDAVDALSEPERSMVAGGLLLGLRVAPPEAAPPGAADEFLVRALLSADPDAGTVTVGAAVAVGDVVRLHARDAQSADRELRDELALRREALGARPAAGALVFTCNGRGRGLFGIADHDATALADELGRPPAAGFFAAGEIGPVGGQPFMHGYTATLAVFP